MGEYQALMEEPPSGYNHGRGALGGSSEGDEQWQALDVETHQTQEFMRDGGFSVADTSYGHGSGAAYGYRDAGMTSSRSSKNDELHVDTDKLLELVESNLGFTLAQIAEAYSTGRPNADRLAIRSQIDARLLELSDKGGNMTALARVFGWSIQADGECRAMAGALRRARASRAAA
jgi:hypothetical protein